MLLEMKGSTPSDASSSKSRELNEKAEKMKNELQFFKDKFGAVSKIDLSRTLTDGKAFVTSRCMLRIEICDSVRPAREEKWCACEDVPILNSCVFII